MTEFPRKNQKPGDQRRGVQRRGGLTTAQFSGGGETIDEEKESSILTKREANAPDPRATGVPSLSGERNSSATDPGKKKANWGGGGEMRC